MPMYDFRCVNCSLEAEHLEQFDAPLRPCDIDGCEGIMERVWHGKGTTPMLDAIPGGLVLENYGPVPIKVYSHTERRAIMKERGLVERDTFVPVPGSDKSGIGTVSWSRGIDPQTMKNAQELVARGATRVPTRQYMDDGSVIDTDVRSHNESVAIKQFNYSHGAAPPAMRDLIHTIGHRED